MQRKLRNRHKDRSESLPHPHNWITAVEELDVFGIERDSDYRSGQNLMPLPSVVMVLVTVPLISV